LQENFYSKVSQELKKFDDSPALFYETINTKVQGIFEQAYFERLNGIFEKCHEAQTLQKRRMMIRLKKFLIKNRLMQYQGQMVERLAKQLENQPYKLPHLTEPWDVNIHQTNHPDLENNMLFHLSKVVGRANLAPPEMLQKFVSDPDSAKSMLAYTFDKAELEKLKMDLIRNPEKYTKMLESDSDFYDKEFHKDFDRGFTQLLLEKRLERKEYKHRLNNDGRYEVTENWPWKVEYYQYKMWADQIKKKSFGTLKYVVNRLLVDFKGQEVGNPQSVNFVQEFEPEVFLTKRMELERLSEMLNEHPEIEKIMNPLNPVVEGISSCSDLSSGDSDFNPADVLARYTKNAHVTVGAASSVVDVEDEDFDEMDHEEESEIEAKSGDEGDIMTMR